MTTMTKAMKLAGALLGLMLWGAAHAGTVTYVYTDPQGTPLAEADASGNITARFEYTPYGVSVPSMGAAPNGVGYTGHVNDPETGLVYMQARYYDAEVGRFPSVDPVGPTPGNVYSFSRYAYTNDNPVSFIDPSGMKAAGFGIISDQDCAIFHCENSYSSSSGDDGRDAPRKNVSSVVVDSSQGSNKTIVEIWYKSIGGNSYNHAFIVVTAPDGQRAFVRGGPSGDGGGGAGGLASDSLATDGHSYGNLVVNSGPYVPGTVDWTEKPVATMKVLSTNESAASIYSKLLSFGSLVNKSGLTYHPLSVNSNAFAHQAVMVLGVSRPQAKVWAPGSDTHLNVLRGGP